MTDNIVADQPIPPEKQGQGESPIGGEQVVETGDTVAPAQAQVEEPGTETPKETPEEPAEKAKSEDKDLFEPGGKSYEELRKKMNDQGVELNALRKRHEEIDRTFKGTSEELAAYKKWYDQYYPALNELYQDEAIRARIEGKAKPRQITEEDAEKIAERKLQEFREQTQFERTVDSWISAHPDVKGKLSKDIYEFLEKNDLNPTPEILDAAYAHCNKARLKEIGAKEKEIQSKKVADAAIGGGSSSRSGKVIDPVDNLFSVPVSNFYPGQKF